MNSLNLNKQKETQNKKTVENNLPAKEISGAYQKVHDRYSHGAVSERLDSDKHYRNDDAAHVGSSFTPEKLERNVRASNFSPEENAWFSRGEQSRDKLQSNAIGVSNGPMPERSSNVTKEGLRDERAPAPKSQMEWRTSQNASGQTPQTGSIGKAGSPRVAMGATQESGNQRFSSNISNGASESGMNYSDDFDTAQRYDARSLNNLISTLEGRSVSDAKSQLRQLRDENKIRDFRIIAEGGTRPFIEDKQRVLVTHNEVGKVTKVEIG